MDKYEEVSEKYVRQAHTYLSAREIDKVYNEFYEFEPAKQSGNARLYALEALDQARGGMNDIMQALSEGVGEAARSMVRGVTFRLPQFAGFLFEPLFGRKAINRRDFLP